MENRLAKKFDREEDIVIFNFFCCSFLTVSFNLSSENVPSFYSIVFETVESDRNFSRDIGIEIRECMVHELGTGWAW